MYREPRVEARRLERGPDRLGPRRAGDLRVCAGVFYLDVVVDSGDDVSAGRVAALGGCSMSLQRFDAQANPDSALYFEGGVHDITDSSFSTPLQVPGRGGTFVGGADVTMSGVTFDNLRSESGAAFVAVDSQVRIPPLGETPSRIINAVSGDAAVVLWRSTLHADGVDMGTSRVGPTDDDNAPDDVWVRDIDQFYSMISDASFVCDSTGCADQ